MKKPYRHPGCSPSRWHSTACHLGTGCQRRASRQDGRNLTRLLGWTALPMPDPSHFEVQRNLMESPPVSHDALTGASWNHLADSVQRRWCKSSGQTDWKNIEGQQMMPAAQLHKTPLYFIETKGAFEWLHAKKALFEQGMFSVFFIMKGGIKVLHTSSP